MAGPMCQSGDGNPAVFVGTMLETGDAFTLCDGCLVAWSAALLSAMTGIDATPFIAAVSEPPPILDVSDVPPRQGRQREGFPPTTKVQARSSGGRTRAQRVSAPGPIGGGSDDDDA